MIYGFEGDFAELRAQILDRPVCSRFAIKQNCQMCGEGFHRRDGVCGNEQRRAAIAFFGQDFLKGFQQGRIETIERFVQDEQLGRSTKRDRESQPLQHSFREFASGSILNVIKTDPFELPLEFADRLTFQLGKESPVLKHTALSIESDSFRHVADVLPQFRGYGATFIKHFAGRWANQPEQAAKECRFARAVWTEQRENRAAFDLKANVLERGHVAESLAESVKCQIGVH